MIYSIEGLGYLFSRGRFVDYEGTFYMITFLADTGEEIHVDGPFKYISQALRAREIAKAMTGPLLRDRFVFEVRENNMTN